MASSKRNPKKGLTHKELLKLERKRIRKEKRTTL